jgi:hypothetical protein
MRWVRFKSLAKSTRGAFALKPVVRELLRVAHEAGGVRQHAGRYAAVVGAGAPHVSALDEGDGGAELAARRAAVTPAGPPPITTISWLLFCVMRARRSWAAAARPERGEGLRLYGSVGDGPQPTAPEDRSQDELGLDEGHALSDALPGPPPNGK